jgi:putative ABC transport system substrate-binding protein
MSASCPTGRSRALPPIRSSFGGRTLMPGLIDAHVHVLAFDAALARLPDRRVTLLTLQAAKVVEVPVLFAGAINSALAAKAATSTVPIVFVVGTDPIASGLVTSLSRPRGNLTGAAVMLGELWPKRLQLLHELLPQAGTIGVLINPENRNAASNTRTIEAAAKSLGLSLDVLEARTEREMTPPFCRCSRIGWMPC